MQKLSVVISAFNEEKKIRECLESVLWADEMILVNSSSTDKTAEIARRYTTKIFTRPNDPMLNINKNFGFSKATSPWILSLDADERVTAELKKEIQELLKNPDPSISGYLIPRKNMIFGKWIQHAGWYPDYQLRLFKKGEGAFEEHHVHEMIQVKGETRKLKEHFIHYNYETIGQFLHKLGAIYGINEADELIRKGYVFTYLDSIRFPSREFLRRFFAQKGYQDGLHGLILSLLMAFYHFIVWCLIWERNKFQDNKEDVLSYLNHEVSTQKKEFWFWLLKARKESERHIIKKSWFWMRSKIRFL